MKNYQGVIIEESLENKEVLKKVKIVSTKVEKVTNEHQTPWLSRWTLHTVEISAKEAKKIAEAISKSLDRGHGVHGMPISKMTRTITLFFVINFLYRAKKQRAI